MASFCLIHGSVQSPRGWDLLTPELQRRGHEVVLADLPAGITQLPAEEYRDAILAACASSQDVILVAASMSGIFLPLAAESQRVRKIVYEAAMIAPLGISPMQMVRNDLSMFKLPMKALPAKPTVYILCRDDRTILPDWSRRKARECLGVDPIELPGGHCPHVSRPAELAELLCAIACD